MSLNYLEYPVLYVDDEPANLSTVSYALEDRFSVVTSSSARDALQVLAERDVAVLLADYKMPEMDGAELCARAHELRPDTIRIIVTAYPDLHFAMEAINRGRVSRYLTKPFEDAELVDALRSAIDLVYLQRSVRALELRVLRSGPQGAGQLATTELAEELERARVLIASCLNEATDLVSAARSLAREPAQLGALLDGARASQVLALETLAQLRGNIDRLRQGAPLRPATAPRCVVTRAVETVVRTLRPEVGKFGKLQVQIDGEPVVSMAPTALGQVLTQLIVNAAQALGTERRGPAQIVVRVDATDSEALISVSDTGVGIGAEDHERIFDPFFSTRGRDGLGLAVARELVAAAGGTIAVESMAGQGSTFIVRLPLRTP